MLTVDAIRAMLIALLLPVAFAKLPIFWQLGALYAVVFLASACAQFFNPARLAMIGDIVEEPYRARASGLGQTTISLAGIIGPPIAAPLLFVLGVQWALIVNSLSFVVSFLAILAVRVPPPASGAEAAQHGTFSEEFRAGMRFFASNRVLITILLTIVVVALGSGAINALGVFFAIENLHVPGNLYGLLDAAFGLGAVAGAILASLLASRLGETRTFWLGLLAAGTAILVLARMTNFGLGLGCLALVGLTIAPVNVVAGPLVLHVTPRELVGRVIAVINPTQALASILSVAIAGTLASTVLSGFQAIVLGISFGPIDTILTGTGVLTLLGGFYALVNLRGVTLAKARTPEPAAGIATPEAQAIREP
jgi:MFS family permease